MKYKAVFYDDYDLKNGENAHLTAAQKTIIFFIAVMAIINLLAVIYIRAGKYIYFWDNATYWDISRSVAAGALRQGGFWKNVYNSVAVQDYNYIASLPSAAVAFVFGSSRLAYVLGLVNMYLIPSFIMIYLLAKKVSKAPHIAASITILLFPSMTFLAFNGFVDIGALLMCFVMYNLYYPKKDAAPRLWRYPLIGVLLAAVILWRRYFAFYSVSFVTAMIADCVLFKRKWYGAALAAVVAAAILFFGFRDFVFHKLMADYGNLYSGYKFSVMTDFKLITRYFGLIFMGVLAVCSVLAGLSKDEYKPVFLWLEIVVCFVMFVSTQTHGQQHLLLYIPPLVMITLIMIRYISKEWMLLAISSLAILHSVFVYIPRPQPQNIREIRYLSIIPSFSMLPLERDDADQILALKQMLDATVYDGDTLGVLASSFTLNEDIMKNVEASMGVKPTRPNYIVSLPQVDSRDRDLSPLYSVNYVLAAFPAQTHLAESSQTVVTEAVKSFEVYADIALCYEEVPECETVIDDMTIKLFHRVRDALPSEIDDFTERLYR